MKTIFLIGYKKRQGKDTFANYLIEYLDNSIKISFAYPLKKLISDTFNISLDDIEDLKERDNKICLGLTMRKVLQNFGNKAMKPMFGENIWAFLLKNKILAHKNKQYFIIPDFRFKIEYEIIKELEKEGYKVITIKITRNIIKDDDISENELDDFIFDYQIYNKGNLDDLKYLAKQFVNKIKGG